MSSPSAAGSPKFAIVRLSTVDEQKVADAMAEMSDVRTRHASQPGFAGSITIDLGAGSRLVVNLWETEKDAHIARQGLQGSIAELLGPVTTESTLIGSGPILEFDVTRVSAQMPATGGEDGEPTAAAEALASPGMMRAVVFRTPGGPEVLSVITIPVPEPGPGEVRVKVEAAPVFSADVAARMGAFGSMLPPRPYYPWGGTSPVRWMPLATASPTTGATTR